jgi:hypothetical protein
MLGAVLEDHLEEALLKKMVWLNADERGGLFGAEAPIATFSSKIRLAHALGLIDRPQKRAFDLVREMRNACAHSRCALSFESPELGDVALAVAETSGLEAKTTAHVDHRTSLFLHCMYLVHIVKGKSPADAKKSIYQDLLTLAAQPAELSDAAG